MAVAERMRESILRVAKHIHSEQPRIFVASNEPKGRDRAEIAQIEQIMSAACEYSDRKEREFYEEMYEKYGGDIHDLPWRQQ